MVRLREVLGIEAALKDLFEYPELGEFVRSSRKKTLELIHFRRNWLNPWRHSNV